jgi:hypothetical protein
MESSKRDYGAAAPAACRTASKGYDSREQEEGATASSSKRVPQSPTQDDGVLGTGMQATLTSVPPPVAQQELASDTTELTTCPVAAQQRPLNPAPSDTPPASVKLVASTADLSALRPDEPEVASVASAVARPPRPARARAEKDRKRKTNRQGRRRQVAKERWDAARATSDQEAAERQESEAGARNGAAVLITSQLAPTTVPDLPNMDASCPTAATATPPGDGVGSPKEGDKKQHGPQREVKATQ